MNRSKLTFTAHFLFGLVAVLVITIHPILTVIAVVLFIIYELNEDLHLKDGAYEDIKEFIYGFILGCMLLLKGTQWGDWLWHLVE